VEDSLRVNKRSRRAFVMVVSDRTRLVCYRSPDLGRHRQQTDRSADGRTVQLDAGSGSVWWRDGRGDPRARCEWITRACCRRAEVSPTTRARSVPRDVRGRGVPPRPRRGPRRRLIESPAYSAGSNPRQVPRGLGSRYRTAACTGERRESTRSQARKAKPARPGLSSPVATYATDRPSPPMSKPVLNSARMYSVSNSSVTSENERCSHDA
jgi:hypothetical protein